MARRPVQDGGCGGKRVDGLLQLIHPDRVVAEIGVGVGEIGMSLAERMKELRSDRVPIASSS
jgi:hypothetical protein